MKSLALALVILGSALWAEAAQSRHVWVVTEENHSYESVIGNSNMPYFNSLAAKYGLATHCADRPEADALHWGSDE